MLKKVLDNLYKDKEGRLSLTRISMSLLSVYVVYKILIDDLVNEKTVGVILLAIFSSLEF